MLMLLFLHSILFEIVHNLSFYDNCVYLNDLQTTYLVRDIYAIFMPIHQPVGWLSGRSLASQPMDRGFESRRKLYFLFSIT